VDRLTIPLTPLKRGRLAAASRREVRAAPQKGLARRGYSEPEVKLRSCGSGRREWLALPRLDNIETTLRQYEVILHSHVLVIVGIDRFCEPGLGFGACHLLLGGRGP